MSLHILYTRNGVHHRRTIVCRARVAFLPLCCDDVFNERVHRADLKGVTGFWAIARPAGSQLARKRGHRPDLWHNGGCHKEQRTFYQNPLNVCSVHRSMIGNGASIKKLVHVDATYMYTNNTLNNKRSSIFYCVQYNNSYNSVFLDVIDSCNQIQL